MRLALLGDIALIGRYDRTQSTNVDERVFAVRELVKDCDFVIGNLESPLTSITKTRKCKGVYLRSAPINVETLKYMGVTHVTLANNHTFDYGDKGARETISVLQEAGIKYVGLNNTPEMLYKEESRVMLDGFCCLSANALNYGNKAGQVKTLTWDNIEGFLKQARDKKALPIVSVHFGVEGVHYPAIEHINFFRELALEYDFILHGNHPHAMQGYERSGNSLLIYAQGNLCFDETPVTSIHYTPKETAEERKCYISIIDIEDNHIVSHQVVAMTDLPSGILQKSDVVEKELKKYAQVLANTPEEIQQLRKEEMSSQRSSAQKRDLQFYLNRMNYKYIGAYLNGRKHAKAYAEMFNEYMKVD